MQPPEPGFTRITNTETGGVADVPDSSLPQHYRAGWAPLDETPEPEPEPDPKPVRAKAKKDGPAKDGQGDDGSDTGSEG